MSENLKPGAKEVNGLEVPAMIQDALAKHKAYVEGGKQNRLLLAQAISDLVGYIPEGKMGTPIERVSSEHKRQFLLLVEKDRGGDWTAASLGMFSLGLEADRYPSVVTEIKALISDGEE